MWSRDGLVWERLPERLDFIENGQPGDWNAGSIRSITSIIPEGDHLRIYYGAGSRPQGYRGREGEKDLPRFVGNS